ncbi:hypothetical protein HK103_001369 [Boothiomyces macroporosus]|uniref:Uncharacterized protein n=1 Tax=Boothiomyces macroporosus TaxID=261099 RepID=A0AAD5UAV7_9FUNG|nr:hypothetical protein HK103_001369 [Boothiomyces macroporosus]
MKYLLISAAHAYISFTQVHDDPSCSQSFNADQLADLYYLTSVFKQVAATTGAPGPLGESAGNGPPPTGQNRPPPPPLANGTPPPIRVSMGCYPSISYPGNFAYFLLDSQNTLSYYDKCTFGDCSVGCSLIGTSSYAQNASSSVHCLPQSYVPTVSLTKNYRQKFYNAGQNCNGTVIYYVDVPIYDSCTAIANGYAISTLNGNVLTQNYCADSKCTSCQTSKTIKPWEFKNSCTLVQDGNGLPLFSTVGMLVVNGVEAPPQLNSTTPVPTATATASSSNDQSPSSNVVIISVVVGAVIILLFAIALLSVFYYKRRAKKLDEKFESVAMLPTEPPSVVSGMDRGTQTLTPKNADLFADYYYVAAPVMNSIQPTAPILKRQAGSGRPPPPPTGSGLPNGANGGPGSGFPGGNPPPQGGNGLGMPPPVTIGCFPSVTNPGTYSNWQNTSSGLQFQDQCNSVTCDTGCKVISSVSNKCGSPYQVPDPKLSSSLVQSYYKRMDSTCSTTYASKLVVPVYPQCTSLSNGLFGISLISKTSVVQGLCSDSKCSDCLHSSSIKAWSIQSVCSQTVDSSGNFIYNSVGVLSLGSASSTTDNSTLTSQSNPASVQNSSGASGLSTVAVVVIAVSCALFLLSALLLIYFYDIRGKRKAREARALENIPLQSEPSSYVAGMDRGTFLMYLDRVENEK